MKTFKSISSIEASKKNNDKNTIMIDIRDEKSFNFGHIKKSINLSKDNFKSFISNTDKKNSIIVCCYHGNSSKQAAQILIDCGFEDVYSLEGGYEGWKVNNN